MTPTHSSSRKKPGPVHLCLRFLSPQSPHSIRRPRLWCRPRPSSTSHSRASSLYCPGPCNPQPNIRTCDRRRPLSKRTSGKSFRVPLPPNLSGYMLKKARGKKHDFRRRYFEVKHPGVLCYYSQKPEDPNNAPPRGYAADSYRFTLSGMVLQVASVQCKVLIYAAASCL
jgi:hypothetical protein